VHLSVIKCISIVSKNGRRKLLFFAFCDVFFWKTNGEIESRMCTRWARALALFSIACAFPPHEFASGQIEFARCCGKTIVRSSAMKTTIFYVLCISFSTRYIVKWYLSIEHASYRYYSLNITAKHEYIKCDRILDYVSRWRKFRRRCPWLCCRYLIIVNV